MYGATKPNKIPIAKKKMPIVELIKIPPIKAKKTAINPGHLAIK